MAKAPLEYDNSEAEPLDRGHLSFRDGGWRSQSARQNDEHAFGRLANKWRLVAGCQDVAIPPPPFPLARIDESDKFMPFVSPLIFYSSR
jgi:hypothetical protein